MDKREMSHIQEVFDRSRRRYFYAKHSRTDITSIRFMIFRNIEKQLRIWADASPHKPELHLRMQILCLTIRAALLICQPYRHLTFRQPLAKNRLVEKLRINRNASLFQVFKGEQRVPTTVSAATLRYFETIQGRFDSRKRTTDIRMPFFRSRLLRIWIRCIPLTLQEHV